MKGVPSTPPLAEAPADLLSGHLWLVELIDGHPLRFQLQDSGLLRVGDAERAYDDPAAIPLPLRRAVSHIRTTLEREALTAAVDDVSEVTFVGVATTRRSVPYDLDAMPPFLGTDIWVAAAGSFRPPDAADGIFRRLGLDPINAFSRECHARDFDADQYSIPSSAWYDGPAAGVVIRNKQGHRARLTAGDPPASTAAASAVVASRSIDEVVAAVVSPERIDDIAAALEAAGRPVGVETVTDRLCAAVGRRHPAAFLGTERLDQAAFRSAVAERVQRQIQG